MDLTKIFILSVFGILALFAYRKEIEEQPNIYMTYTPCETDTKRKTLSKLKGCLKAQNRSIKWRRSFLASLLLNVVIFGLIQFRIPDNRDILLYTMVTYCVFYVMWQFAVAGISDPVEKIGNKLISKLRRS